MWFFTLLFHFTQNAGGLSPLCFGGGNLMDLLPEVPEAESDHEQQQQYSGMSRGALRDGSGRSMDGWRGTHGLTGIATSQFPLLEETERGPTQIPAGGVPESSVTKHTLLVIK
jgi:hypothetical protein